MVLYLASSSKRCTSYFLFLDTNCVRPSSPRRCSARYKTYYAWRIRLVHNQKTLITNTNVILEPPYYDLPQRDRAGVGGYHGFLFPCQLLGSYLPRVSTVRYRSVCSVPVLRLYVTEVSGAGIDVAYRVTEVSGIGIDVAPSLWKCPVQA